MRPKASGFSSAVILSAPSFSNASFAFVFISWRFAAGESGISFTMTATRFFIC